MNAVMKSFFYPNVQIREIFAFSNCWSLLRTEKVKSIFRKLYLVLPMQPDFVSSSE